MKIKRILTLGVFTGITLLLTGCTSMVIDGISHEQSKQYPMVMVNKQQMICGGTTIIKKGSIFGARSAAGFKAQMSGNDVILPENSIMLQGAMGDNVALRLLVYPNGKFVYKNFHMFMIAQGNITGFTDLCKTELEEPFEIRNNQ